jgi:photosystem II stability/assembly factor-like uncharacterized protein
MNRYAGVLAILDKAIGGPDVTIGAHGAFWRGLSRDQFVARKVFGRQLVDPGKGADSNLVKALKGETPFGSDLPNPPDGAIFQRMPVDLPAVSSDDISFIQQWIDDGCPETLDAGFAALAAQDTAPALRWRATNAPTASSRTDDIWFLNAQTGWAVNSNGHILKTADGGQTWTKQFTTGAYLRCVGFADAQHGWAGTLSPSRRLFATADGGERWDQVEGLPANAPARICGLAVVNSMTVYASGTNIPTDVPRMMKTTDGGRTWTAWDMRQWASILIDTYFIDEKRGWVVGGKADDPTPQDRSEIRPVVLYTQNGGQTWVNRLAGQEGDFPFGEWAWKIQFLNDRVGFISLENFTDAAILKTSDGGLSWTRVKVRDPQSNANLEGIGFINEKQGWVGGWGDAALQSGLSSATEDGGATWRDANEIGRFINRIRFFGNPVSVGYASGLTVYKYSAETPGLAGLAALPPADARVLLPRDQLRAEALPMRIPAAIPPAAARVTLDVWDRFGQHIAVAVDETQPTPGERTLLWDGRDGTGRPVPDGTYLLRLTADKEAESSILVLRTGPAHPTTRGLRWVRHELRLPATSSLRAFSALAVPSDKAALAGDTMVQIDLPDLSAFPRPIDKAAFLLHAAAEIEHALLVQYLYAGYSLKKPGMVADAQQKAALRTWPRRLADIAKEEMGHLLTVQNLRLLIRQRPDFRREDFPEPPNIYPFTMQLQPLSQASLAKYVVAESPTSASGIEDIIQQATQEAGTMPNRVGILYALLGMIFTRQSELGSNAQGGDPWYTIVRDIGNLALTVCDSDPLHWHLPDDAFDAASIARQSPAEDWAPGQQIRVFAAQDRRAALTALGDIALQGEGPVQSGSDSTGSHFERFLSIYRGGAGIIPFPPAGQWQPSLNVPTDPKVEQPASDPNVITSQKAVDFARLADLRYQLLLGFLEQYFLTEPAQRGFLVTWSYEEMKTLRVLAGVLTTTPRRNGQADAFAALPFTLPSVLALPVEQSEQWRVHIGRFDAAVALAKTMLETHSPGDVFLTQTMQADHARRAVAVQAQQGTLPQEPSGDWGRVRRILEAAAGFGSPNHDGEGRFWNRPLPQFVALSILQQPLIAPLGPNRGANSNLVKALKGEPPFDGSDFPRMPLNRQAVAPEHIAFIQDWIDRGCPEN